MSPPPSCSPLTMKEAKTRYKSPFLIETFLQTGSEPGPPVTLMRAGMYGPPGQTPTRTLKGM